MFWRTEHFSPDDGPRFSIVLGFRAERQYGKVLAQLAPHLEPGEALAAYFVANTMKPLITGIAVTDRRLLAWNGSDLARKPPRFSFAGSEIEAFSLTRSGFTKAPELVVTTRSTEAVLVGRLRTDDNEELLREAVSRLVHRAGSARLRHRSASPREPERPAKPHPRPPQPVVAPPVEIPVQVSGTTEQHAQVARLLEEGVIDDAQAIYLRSVLFG